MGERGRSSGDSARVAAAANKELDVGQRAGQP